MVKLDFNRVFTKLANLQMDFRAMATNDEGEVKPGHNLAQAQNHLRQTISYLCDFEKEILLAKDEKKKK